MATNFPSSADSFTNPTSGDTLDNPPHDQQHANINDAMEAVQASLLDGAPLHIDDANSRVGVGTTSPSTTLDVAGAVSADGFVYVGAFDAIEGGELQLDKGTSGSHHFRLDNYNDNGRFLSSTAVMANINLSTHRLDVYGDINATGDLRIGGTAIGEWQSYTPTLTNWTTSAQNFEYAVVNDVVFVRVYAVVATMGSFPTFTTPTTIGRSPNFQRVGLLDSGSTWFDGMLMYLNTTTVNLMCVYTAGTFAGYYGVNATSPHTWAAGDAVDGLFVYGKA